MSFDKDIHILTDLILPPISVPIPNGDPLIANNAPSPPLLPPGEILNRL